MLITAIFSFKNSAANDVNPKVWTKNLINYFGIEFGIVLDSFLLVLERFVVIVYIFFQLVNESVNAFKFFAVKHLHFQSSKEVFHYAVIQAISFSLTIHYFKKS